MKSPIAGMSFLPDQHGGRATETIPAHPGASWLGPPGLGDLTEPALVRTRSPWEGRTLVRVFTGQPWDWPSELRAVSGENNNNENSS